MTDTRARTTEPTPMSALPIFIAHTEFRFEADSVEAAGKRIIELAKAANTVGFDMKSGHVDPAPPDDDSDGTGWTGDGPER
jgi:hypothetical protein